MRFLFTIFILSISLLAYGQSENDFSVRINNEPLDSLPKYIFKINNIEYGFYTIPDSINPKWIKRIEYLISDNQKHIYGNNKGIVLIYPYKRHSEKLTLILRESLKHKEDNK